MALPLQQRLRRCHLLGTATGLLAERRETERECEFEFWDKQTCDIRAKTRTCALRNHTMNIHEGIEARALLGGVSEGV